MAGRTFYALYFTTNGSYSFSGFGCNIVKFDNKTYRDNFVAKYGDKIDTVLAAIAVTAKTFVTDKGCHKPVRVCNAF